MVIAEVPRAYTLLPRIVSCLCHMYIFLDNSSVKTCIGMKLKGQ